MWGTPHNTNWVQLQSRRVFGRNGLCQVANTCIWRSRASQEIFALSYWCHIPCFSLQSLGSRLWFRLTIYSGLDTCWPSILKGIVPSFILKQYQDTQRENLWQIWICCLCMWYTKQEVEIDWDLGERALSQCQKFILEGNIQICLWKGPQNHRGLWLHFSACRG